MDLIFRIKNVNFVNQSIRKTLHTDRFLPAGLLDNININLNPLKLKAKKKDDTITMHFYADPASLLDFFQNHIDCVQYF